VCCPNSATKVQQKERKLHQFCVNNIILKALPFNEYKFSFVRMQCMLELSLRSSTLYRQKAKIDIDLGIE